MQTEILEDVQIPENFVLLAGEWYDGSGSMLYAIASTGNLTIGTWKPAIAKNRQDWHCHLFEKLSDELYRLCKQVGEGGNDYDKLKAFWDWTDSTVEDLKNAYNLPEDE